MTQDGSSDRRRFLQQAGLGSAAVLAGCSAPSSSDSDTTNNTTDNSDMDTEQTSGETFEVGITAALNRQEYQALRIQLQSGQIGEEEYNTQAEQLLQTAVNNLRTYFEDETSITVDDETVAVLNLQAIGVLRVSGPAAELIESVQSEHGESIVSADNFDQISQQVENSG